MTTQHRLALSRDAFREQVASAVAKLGVPGIAVVVRQGGLAEEFSCGSVAKGDRRPISASSEFEIGCLSNFLVCLVLLEEVRHGRLHLDASLQDLLPELRSWRNAARIKLWHVMSGSAGYRGPTYHFLTTAPWDEHVAYLASATQLFEPGAAFNYHLCDHAILSSIVSRIRSMEVLDVLQGTYGCRNARNTFDAAIGHGWDQATSQFVAWPRTDDCDESRREHQLRVSPFRLLEIVAGIGDAGELRQWAGQCGTSIPSNPAAAISTIGMPVWSGLGFGKYADGTFGVTGSTHGQCCAVRFHAESNTALAIGMNTRTIDLRDHIACVLMRQLLGIRADDLQLPLPPPFTSSELAGSYIGGTLDDESILVSERGDRVVCQVTLAGRKVEFLVRLDEQSRPVPVPGPMPARLMFFREPASGRTCLQFGTRAYIKES